MVLYNFSLGPTFRQYWASLTCSLVVAATAAGFVWLTPLMNRLEMDGAEIRISQWEMSWIVASIEFGEFISPLPAAYFTDRWGRKPLMLSAGPLCVISWILVLTTRSIPVLYVVRVLQGMGVGIAYTVGPMYIAEVSEPRIRGELSGQFQTMWYVGILYAYCLGPYLGYQEYAYACAALPVLFLLAFSFAPESPYYLVMVNKWAEAEKSLKWLRATDQVSVELESIVRSVQEETKMKSGGMLSSWRELVATKSDRMSLLIVQSVCFIKYMIGMPAIISYSTYTFAQSSGGLLDEHMLTIGMGCVLLISTFLAAYVVDWIGRRPLLLASTIGSLAFTSFIGLYYFLDGVLTVDVSRYAWLMYASLGGYCIVCSIGLGPILQTIQAEVFPSNTRGLGGGLSAITGTITTFLVLKLYQTVEEGFGVYMNFFMYAFFALLGSILLCVILPETAGKSLGQIQTDMKTTYTQPTSDNLNSEHPQLTIITPQK